MTAGLEGKVALVTGSGAGIGRAIAHRLAAGGAAVAVADINAKWADETAGQVRSSGGTAEAFEFDLASTAAIETMVETAARRFGRIDVLVNNAGVNGALSLLEVTPEEWDHVMGVNARGTFFCLQAVARRMRTGSVPYAASKAAVIAMTRFAALHLAAHNINVNAICPGPTRSDAFSGIAKTYAGEHDMTIEAAFNVLDEFIPLKRSNEPSDIAAMVAFLASDDSRNITGQSFNVDGGLTWD